MKALCSLIFILLFLDSQVIVNGLVLESIDIHNREAGNASRNLRLQIHPSENLNKKYSILDRQTFLKNREETPLFMQSLPERRLQLKFKQKNIKNKPISKSVARNLKDKKTKARRLNAEEFPPNPNPQKEEKKFEPPKPPKMEPPSFPSFEIEGLDLPDPKELLMKAMGMGPKGNNISKMIGGNLNVQLGKEGSPIYIDQSPSYIYHNPKSEYNQNGIRMPLSANSAIATPYSPQIVSTNFIRPRSLKSQPTLIVSDQNGYSVPNRKLGNMNLKNIVSSQQTGIIATPEGPLVQTTLQDVYPEDPTFANEGEQQLSETMDSARLFDRALNLIGSIKSEIEGVEDTMKKNNDKIDTIINRLFDIKFS